MVLAQHSFCYEGSTFFDLQGLTSCWHNDSWGFFFKMETNSTTRAARGEPWYTLRSEVAEVAGCGNFLWETPPAHPPSEKNKETRIYRLKSCAGWCRLEWRWRKLLIEQAVSPCKNRPTSYSTNQGVFFFLMLLQGLMHPRWLAQILWFNQIIGIRTPFIFVIRHP